MTQASPDIALHLVDTDGLSSALAELPAGAHLLAWLADAAWEEETVGAIFDGAEARPLATLALTGHRPDDIFQALVARLGATTEVPRAAVSVLGGLDPESTLREFIAACAEQSSQDPRVVLVVGSEDIARRLHERLAAAVA